MSHVSLDDVKKLAALSALDLNEEQAANLRGDMEEILGYFEQLQTVNTDGIEPTYEVHGLDTITRPDVVQDSGIDTGAMLRNAPQHNKESIIVPRVLE